MNILKTMAAAAGMVCLFGAGASTRAADVYRTCGFHNGVTVVCTNVEKTFDYAGKCEYQGGNRWIRKVMVYNDTNDIPADSHPIWDYMASLVCPTAAPPDGNINAGYKTFLKESPLYLPPPELPWEVDIGGPIGAAYGWNRQYEIDWHLPQVANGVDLMTVFADNDMRSGRSLKIALPPDLICADACREGCGQVQLRTQLAKGYDTVYAGFKIRFAPSFDYNWGLKAGLGFGGGSCPTGGQDASEGWSVRTTVWGDRRLSLYIYHPDQTGGYGAHFPAPVGEVLLPGRTYHVELFINLNTPGLKDGEVTAWVDGKKTHNLSGIRFRNNYTQNADQVLFTNCFGGDSHAVYAPDKTETLFIGDIVLYETRPQGLPDDIADPVDEDEKPAPDDEGPDEDQDQAQAEDQDDHDIFVEELVLIIDTDNTSDEGSVESSDTRDEAAAAAADYYNNENDGEGEAEEEEDNTARICITGEGLDRDVEVQCFVNSLMDNKSNK